MKFIPEEQIDRAAETLEASEQVFLQNIEELEKRYPIVFSYLNSENLALLTSTERDYMFFLLAVLWKSVKDELSDRGFISEKKLGEAEERNWTLLQETKSKRFQDRLDAFFEDYPQEDLLAFLEDAVAEEEEEEGILTREGREPIFIILKSVLDCWVF